MTTRIERFTIDMLLKYLNRLGKQVQLTVVDFDVTLVRCRASHEETASPKQHRCGSRNREPQEIQFQKPTNLYH